MRLRKIKYKLLLLLGLLLTLYAGLSVFLYASAASFYGDVLNQAIDYALNLAAAEMERKISDIENYSLAAMSNPMFQELLNQHYASETIFSRYIVRGTIHEFLTLNQVNPYIDELFVIDRSGKLIADDDGATIAEGDIEGLRALAQELDGRQALYATQDGSRLLMSRMVRESENLSFRSMGTLVIEMDIVSMLADTVKDLWGLNLTIGLQIRDNEFLSAEFLEPLPPNITSSPNGSVFEIENEEYLSYHINMHKSERVYSAYLPRKVVYGRIDKLNFATMAALLVITAIAAATGLILVSHITRPLEMLVLRLRKLEDTDFSEPDVRFTLPRRHDEIGLLYREVEAMFGKINRLINEIYKKQIAVKDHQFRALQAQINPHFLYNTLESINWLAKLAGHEEISDMIKSLGNLLRASITRGEYAISLEREIQLVKNYLTIQQMRYDDDLQSNLDIEGDITLIGVPKLIVQPLVENSIKYGLEYRKQTCHIDILIKVTDDSVDISVADDGCGMDEIALRELNFGRIQPKGSGVGIKNITERLNLIYGNTAYLRVDSEPDTGTTVRLHIPITSVKELERRIPT